MPSSKPQPVQQTQSATTAPWSEQQPHLKFGFEEARKLYDDPTKPTFFPGQTYANMSPETDMALTSMMGRATAGSPVLNAAQAEANKSLSGHYLDAGNPHFSAMAERVRAETLPGLDARFAMAGRAGSGLHGRSAALGVGDAIGSLAYGDYNNERNRMSQYAGMAPQLAQADYLDPQMLGQVGATREEWAQKGIGEDMARHEFDQSAPYGKLANYMQMIQGQYGGQSNTTSTQFLPSTNPWMQGLGMLMQGAGTAGMMFSDERLKENIEPIGETFEGTPLYRWNYRGGGPPMFGPLAQDVAERQPEAVGLADYMGKSYLTIDPKKVR